MIWFAVLMPPKTRPEKPAPGSICSVCRTAKATRVIRIRGHQPYAICATCMENNKDRITAALITANIQDHGRPKTILY